MINAAVMLSGGMWVQRKLGEINLPQLSRPVDEVGAFKLSVTVHAASVQGLSDPSLLKRERPRVEIVVGQFRKETELGDFRPDAIRGGASFKKIEAPSSSVEKDDGREGNEKDNDMDKDDAKEKDAEAKGGKEGKEAKDSEAPPEGVACSWTFGDTLTFTATRADVLGTGVQVWLRTQSEVRLGTLLQVNMSQSCEVGMCTIDLRRRVLPTCLARGGADSTGGSAEGSGGAPRIWDSSLMTVPVTHVGGGRAPPGDKPFVLGENSGHVQLSFSVNMDPQVLLKSADESTMPMVQRFAVAGQEWAGAALPVAQEWTVKAAGVTSQLVRTAAIQTSTALEEPVKWVLENADIETCTTKTRDRASRFIEDVPYTCGQQNLPDGTPRTTVVQHATARAFMSPKSPGTKSQATTLTPSPQRGLSHTTFNSTFTSGFQNLGSGISGAGASSPPQTVKMVSVIPRSAPSPPRAEVVSSAAPSSSSTGPVPATTSRPRPAASASAAAPAGAVRSSPSGGSSSNGKVSPRGGSQAQLLPPPPPTAQAVAMQQQARRATPAYYVPAGQAGLPTRQSFQVQPGLPTRQSFQVVHVVPGGYPQQGLPPSRQSFQVVSGAAPMRQAAPQYVRPGTIS